MRPAVGGTEGTGFDDLVRERWRKNNEGLIMDRMAINKGDKEE